MVVVFALQLMMRRTAVQIILRRSTQPQQHQRIDAALNRHHRLDRRPQVLRHDFGTRSRVAASTRSALFSTTMSAHWICSSNSSSSGFHGRANHRLARRLHRFRIAAKRPAATASASITAMTPSTVTRVRISGHAKALTSGLGSAKPDVSITI